MEQSVETKPITWFVDRIEETIVYTSPSGLIQSVRLADTDAAKLHYLLQFNGFTYEDTHENKGNS